MIRIALALALAVAGPAGMPTSQAAAAETSAIHGWRTAPLTVKPHARRTFVLRVATDGAPRAVRIQIRAAGKTRWRPGTRQRTGKHGKVRYRWQAPLNPGAYQIRAVAPRRDQAARVVSAVRSVVVHDPSLGEVRALVEEVNRARSKARRCGGTTYAAVPPLTVDSRLVTSARRHAQAMADKDYFDHTSPDGRTPSDRARAAGYRGGVGENIAAGPDTAAEIIRMWLRSPGHCGNIMSTLYHSLGVGHGYQPTARYRHYWVLDLGMR